MLAVFAQKAGMVNGMPTSPLSRLVKVQCPFSFALTVFTVIILSITHGAGLINDESYLLASRPRWY